MCTCIHTYIFTTIYIYTYTYIHTYCTDEFYIPEKKVFQDWKQWFFCPFNDLRRESSSPTAARCATWATKETPITDVMAISYVQLFYIT